MARNVLQSILGRLAQARHQLEAKALRIADQVSRIDAVLRSGSGRARRKGRKSAAASKRGGKRRISVCLANCRSRSHGRFEQPATMALAPPARVSRSWSAGKRMAGRALEQARRIAYFQGRLEFATHRQRSIKFHGEIYVAIENGDALKARKIMADVLQFAGIQTLKVLGIDSGRTRK